MSVYDTLAHDFDRHRALPGDAPAAIRSAVLAAVPDIDRPLLLDLGAGSGRIGTAFVAARDRYVGVDLSLGMLRAFRVRRDLPDELARLLVQADGERLPFRDATFDAMLLMQVLSAAQDWRRLIAEAERVLHPTGALIIGRTVAPEDGVDAQMKQHLTGVLEAAGIQPHQKTSADDAADWLARSGWSIRCTTAITWTTERTPRGFVERHGNGARFSVLPPSIRDVAMLRLRAWAVATFGSLDAVRVESFRFELMICRHQPGKPH